jgi:glycosyltransferase involved in cell wall biosynthesis
MLDVAVVTPRYPPVSSGGGETSAKLLATQLAASDRIGDVVVFSFDGTGTERRDGVTVTRLGRVPPTVTEYQNLRAAWRLRNRLESFNIVHSYNMELHPTVGFLSNHSDVTSVATLNSYHFFPASVTNTTPRPIERLYETVGHPTTGRIMRYYMRQIDAFVALSRAIREIYEQRGFGDCRIEHIPNMIDPDFESVSDVSTDGYSLLYVGSLTENKGVKHLVEAVSLLPESYHLRIIGTGPRQELLEETAVECGVSDRIEFSGRISYDEIGAAYAEANVFVHPGIWPEPLNRTAMEAMQSGLPVVCTAIGGPPEVIPDAELLCEPANPSVLAETIETARESRDAVGNRNRNHIHERYAPSVIVPRIIDLYETLTTPN